MSDNYKDQLQEDYLIHFGVPGMKWGVRKSVYRSMTRSQRKAQKLKIKDQRHQNKQAFRAAKRKANEKFYKDTEAYNNANTRMHDKFESKQHDMNRKYNNAETVLGTVLGSHGSNMVNKIRENNQTVIDYNRDKAQKALDKKYEESNNKAYAKRSATIKKAREVYKQNKKKIASGKYK